MRNILCFGDSNTWGYIPGTGERYDRTIRWTGLLQLLLGQNYYIIEEGLNGRTTVWDDPVEEHKNGKEQLHVALQSHKPLDLVILMLGTNDLKTRYNVPTIDIQLSITLLISIIKQSCAGRDGKTPKILLLAPPHVEELTQFSEMFIGAQEKSKLFASYYRATAQETNSYFLDIGSLAKPSTIDGIHFDSQGHNKLAHILTNMLKNSVFNDIEEN